MLTPDAIAALADLGFYFDAEPCPLRYILADIQSAYWADDVESAAAVHAIVDKATQIATEGWRLVVA